MKPEQTIEGVVDRIVYSNEENGWSVVRLVVRGKGQVTAVGNLFGVQPGESLRLTGHWESDARFGPQLRVGGFMSVKPSTYVGIEKYLGSGLVKGVGPSLAKRLVQHFGLDTLDVIDHHPERLEEVDGIGPVRSKRIREAWDEQRGVREVMVFLQSHGVSTAHAVKIYKRFKEQAIATVRRNPYCLAEEIHGIGFRTADRIARDLDIPADSPERARAGILFALSQAADDGHVYRPRVDLLHEAAELLEFGKDSDSGSDSETGGDPALLETAISKLVEDGELVEVELPLPGARPAAHPGAAPPTGIYLAPLEQAERGAAEALRRLLAQRHLPLQIDVGRAVRWFEKEESITLAEPQRRALEMALTHKVLVLTGGPGTGKTTLVRGIVKILTAKGLRVSLAAPTGRAAKRLGEATSQEARTIHRLLEFNPRAGGFQRGPEQPLDTDVLVVDEVSMLDTSLAYHLFRALPERAALILVGDVDQLPSVGPGQVLDDILASGVATVARLSEIFRQGRESQIVENAHRVRQGGLPQGSRDPQSDFFLIEREDPEALLATLKKLVGERIPKSFGFDPRTAIQVLTPMQRGLLGAVNLNAELQALLNPQGEEVTRGGRILRVGDRVMQIRNNYDLEVWNGDIGHIDILDPVEQELQVDYDGRRVRYDFADLDELRLAYACSIHKSQGSEYPCVVIPIHTQHYMLLQRNLLYTAITRGRRLVVLLGSRKAITLAVDNVRASTRSTLLAHRLAGGGGSDSEFGRASLP